VAEVTQLVDHLLKESPSSATPSSEIVNEDPCEVRHLTGRNSVEFVPRGGLQGDQSGADQTAVVMSCQAGSREELSILPLAGMGQAGLR
jgi:hypothetical protein